MNPLKQILTPTIGHTPGPVRTMTDREKGQVQEVLFSKISVPNSEGQLEKAHKL